MLQKKNEGILFSAEIRVVGSYTDRLLIFFSPSPALKSICFSTDVGVLKQNRSAKQTKWAVHSFDFVAVFLRLESLPEAPLPCLRGLNKANRSSRFFDVDAWETSESSCFVALQRLRRRIRSPMVQTPSRANSLSEAEITVSTSTFSSLNLSTRVPKFSFRRMSSINVIDKNDL